MLNNRLYNAYRGNVISFFLCKCFNNLRKDFSTADCHRSGTQETISEFPPADENAVARSQLSAGNSTDENANTTFSYPAGRNDIEICYLPERGPDHTGKQISKQTKLMNII